jgi:hypothetical protein
VLTLAACGGAGDERAQAPARVIDPRQAVLRLSDLPRGYEYGDDTACGGVSATEGDWPLLQPLFASEQPRGCIVEFGWVWSTSPEFPHGLTSAVFVFDDAAGARRAFEARDELARFTASLDAVRREDVELGDEAELLRGRGLNDRASAVVWRDGNLVGVLAGEPADDAVRELAERQHERIRRSSPFPALDARDPELQLDDPSLDLPVYWLGRTYEPPGDLPALGLDLAAVGANGPGQSIQLWYGMRGFPGTVTFDTYRPEDWRRFRRTLLGRLIWDSPCAHKTVVRLPIGRAEIYQGYGAPRPVLRPCPERRADRVLAHVHAGDVVIVVNLPYCYACARPRSPRNPYETVEATERLVRALKLREPRR